MNNVDLNSADARPRRSTPSQTLVFFAVAVIATLLAAGCSSADEDVIAGEGDLGHIHDFVLRDDDTLLVASHTGLYRIEGRDRAVLIGPEQHDLMSMTGLPDGDILASGHPDLRIQEYRVEDRPPFLGLARSTDGGESWEVVDLLGDADFHALVPVGQELFAAESSGQIWHLDPDGIWTQLGQVEARDLAVNPKDPKQQVAPGYSGVVFASTDGAVSWSQLPETPAMVEIEWTDDSMIVGFDQTGAVWNASGLGSEWTQIATGPAEVETFHVDDLGNWWVSVHGGAISRSSDLGTTWSEIYVPPGS